jgi:halimadienyl-diphosphate synthase
METPSAPLLRTNQAANALLAQVSADPYGRVSASVYESARVVALAPWLTGHANRIRFLVRTQHPNGRWGGPDEYGLAPTLSAVQALLSTMDSPLVAATPDHDDIVGAVNRGLAALLSWLGDGRRVPALADTVGAEVVIPHLVSTINRHLDGHHERPVPGLHPIPQHVRLTMPAGMDDTLVNALTAMVAQGHRLQPEQLSHSLEVLGETARGTPCVSPVDGAIGISPAATAAWLTPETARQAAHPSVLYLQAMQARHQGPVSTVSPITFFERLWVVDSLSRAGLDLTVPDTLITSLRAGLTDCGVPVAPGLPADADDTAVVLLTLSAVGAAEPVDCLSAYEREHYFACYLVERTPSTSTNAHVLEALRADPQDRGGARWQPQLDKITDWLLDHQEPDGCWWDKWHSSPYYATVCCVQALTRSPHPRTDTAVARARQWVLATQRSDGSWGRWEGTDEETAYAVLSLLSATPPDNGDTAVRAAVERGADFLLRTIDHTDDDARYPGLWHGKELYAPIAVIQAARLAALHLASLRVRP